MKLILYFIAFGGMLCALAALSKGGSKDAITREIKNYSDSVLLAKIEYNMAGGMPFRGDYKSDSDYYKAVDVLAYKHRAAKKKEWHYQWKVDSLNLVLKGK